MSLIININIGNKVVSPPRFRSVRLVNLMACTSIFSSSAYLILYISLSMLSAVVLTCCAILCYAMTLVFNNFHLFRLARIWQVTSFSIHIFILTYFVFSKNTGFHYILFSIPPASFLLNRYGNHLEKITLSSMAFIFFLTCELASSPGPLIRLSDEMSRSFFLFSQVSLYLGLTAFVWLFTYDIHQYRESQEKLIAELDNSLKEINRLRGILPICSHCKKIRDDKGYWSQIESYISEHSEAVFSHSICPECAEKFYPDLVPLKVASDSGKRLKPLDKDRS